MNCTFLCCDNLKDIAIDKIYAPNAIYKYYYVSYYDATGNPIERCKYLKNKINIIMKNRYFKHKHVYEEIELDC